ncbi:concanavalin A-like lectin/glucanase domain-containing protein [Russula aff. rugulosa BPL654]|nr:concanavalin A-like lectin/glucanase domain-containing protein [Russula aff. rugulosa BPL654]
MRFSLDSALLFLAFAHALVAPVTAIEGNEPKRHVLSRASHGFRRSNLGKKPYCVSTGNRQPNSTGITDTFSTMSPGLKPTASRSTTTSPTSIPGQSNFRLAQSYSGQSFFQGWDFFTGSDPTNGNVQFVDQQTATSNNLTSINAAGNAIMRVDNTAQVSGNRNSVRIQTQFTFTGGLVIMDSVHMPTGCGTWPAFWTDGANWPVTGEIDIVEGVNNYTNNQVTVHANTGCQLPTNNVTALGISGSIVSGTNCAALQTNNEGCGVRASQTNSFGEPFNNNGGGVYAMLWDNTGVSVWFFPRQNIPSDITAQAPVPPGWGHSAIFDTTLCGDWAGSVWTATGVPGQDQSCAQRTGVATCQQFVQQNGAALSEAYWEVKSVEIYQSK